MPPGNGFIAQFLRPVFPNGEYGPGSFTVNEYGLMAFATAVALGGIFLALGMYAWRLPALDPKMWTAKLRPLYTVLYNKYYYDHIYDALFVRPSRHLGMLLWRFDVRGVDGVVEDVSKTIWDSGGILRRLQTGFVGNYALVIGIGLIAIIAYLFLR